MKVKKNDNVLILTGKDSGKTGKVLRAIPSENKIVVDGINIQKKHKKARSAQETSSIVEQAGAIDASNAQVICPACGKAVRVNYVVENGKKVRVCNKCKAHLDVAAAEKKATKTAKTAKATKTSKTEKATKASKTAKTEKEAKPVKETKAKTSKKAATKKADAE